MGMPRAARCVAGAFAAFHRGVVHRQVRELGEQTLRERSVARADLHDPESIGIAQVGVELPQPAREQLGEHGMHVRARDERGVGLGPDRRSSIEALRTVERELHESIEADRSVPLDLAADRSLGVPHGRAG